MGYSTVKIHVRVNSAEDERKVKEYFESKCSGADDFIEDVPEEFISQPEYLSICSDKVRFDNFEMIAEELSGTLGMDALVALVFDSDVAVIEGYSSGIKILEEVNSTEEKKKMDRKLFVERFAPNCTEEQIASIWDNGIDVFAEDILVEMGEIMGIKLLLD